VTIPAIFRIGFLTLGIRGTKGKKIIIIIITNDYSVRNAQALYN